MLSDTHVPYVPANYRESKVCAFHQLPDSKAWAPVDRLIELEDYVNQKVKSLPEGPPPCLEGKSKCNTEDFCQIS